MEGVRTGHLVIADVSGCTRFVNTSELEHARDILSDLLSTIAASLEGPFTIEKVEGDAIFAVTAGDPLSGHALVTAMEACYGAFCRRRDTMKYLSSCACTACDDVPGLDLRIVAHHGQFARHTVAGRAEALGTDAITVHRLLKNSVPLRGYGMLTATCVTSTGLDPNLLGASLHVEEFEGVGPIESWVIDLAQWWDGQRETREIRVGDGALINESVVLPVAPAQAWRWITDPQLRPRYQPSTDHVDQTNPSGVPGVGTRNHCVHGQQAVEEEVVDWKPYRYFTVDAATPMGPVRITFDLEPVEDGTRTKVTFRGQAMGGTKQRLMLAVGVKRLFAKQVRATMAKLHDLLVSEDVAT